MIAGNDISLNQEHLPITNELSSETSADQDEAKFDEGHQWTMFQFKEMK